MRGRLLGVSTSRAQSSRTGYSLPWTSSRPGWCQLQRMCSRCIVRGLAPRLNWRKHLERVVYPLQRVIRWRSREMHQEKRSCRNLRRLSDYYRRPGWPGWLWLIALFSFMGDEFARSFWYPRDFSGVLYESGLSLGPWLSADSLTKQTKVPHPARQPALVDSWTTHRTHRSHRSRQYREQKENHLTTTFRRTLILPKTRWSEKREYPTRNYH